MENLKQTCVHVAEVACQRWGVYLNDRFTHMYSVTHRCPPIFEHLLILHGITGRDVPKNPGPPDKMSACRPPHPILYIAWPPNLLGHPCPCSHLPKQQAHGMDNPGWKANPTGRNIFVFYLRCYFIGRDRYSRKSNAVRFVKT